MSEHYLLPIEFLGLLTFWFGLPLLIAFMPLTGVLILRRQFRANVIRLIGAFVLTAVLSIAVGCGLLIWSPPFLRFLGVRDFFIADMILPVLPLSFVVVAAFSLPTGWWTLRTARPNLAINSGEVQMARPLL
jgi:hypothetical protein